MGRRCRFLALGMQAMPGEHEKQEDGASAWL